MRRIIGAFLAALLALSATGCGDEKDWVIEQGVVKGYRGAKTDLKIPKGATSIMAGAFKGKGVTSIVIPDGVTEIGRGAFENCNALESITIPKSVTSIGEDAFFGCYKLIQTEGGVKYVDKWAVGSGSDMDSKVALREGTEGIAYGAFAFSNLMNITIPSSVTTIGENAFAGCEWLELIKIPDSVTSIGAGAFSGCIYLARITMSNSVTSIGDYAFAYCYDLRSITIPNSVTSIGGYAFAGCEDLESIEIPDSVRSIGDYAFYECYDLESITIPKSVAKIGEGAFFCSYPPEIEFDGTTMQWYAIRKGALWDDEGSCTVYCTDGEIETE